jgi:hypothetical protein
MRQWVALVAVAICASHPLFAQSEAALWEALEGRTAIAKVDLPATKSGVEIYPDASPATNDAQYGKQLKQFGAAARRREPVTITDVKVNPKSIEIELGRSDSGTDSSSQVYVAAAKSARENALERDLEGETDPARRERMEKELEELRAKRAREDARLKAALAQLARDGQASNRSRAASGMRFNLVFPSGVPSRALRPDYVMAALKPWIDFASAPEADRSDAASHLAQLPPQQPSSEDTSSVQELRKGMTEPDLKRLLGDPLKREPYLEGDLHVEILTFKRNDATLEATMVEGVLVKFREWSD